MKRGFLFQKSAALLYFNTQNVRAVTKRKDSPEKMSKEPICLQVIRALHFQFRILQLLI